MLDGPHREINIEIRPVKVIGMKQLHPEKLPHGGFPEPGEFLELGEHLPALNQDPEAVPRDIRDFSG